MTVDETGVDETVVDKTGVDETGVDELGINHPPNQLSEHHTGIEAHKINCVHARSQ